MKALRVVPDQDPPKPDADARRRAVEAALTADQRAVFAQACHLFGLAPDAWTTVGSLACIVTAIAVQQRAANYQDGPEGMPWGAALARACVELGVNVESHVRQLRKWRAKSPGDLPAADESCGVLP